MTTEERQRVLYSLSSEEIQQIMERQSTEMLWNIVAFREDVQEERIGKVGYFELRLDYRGKKISGGNADILIRKRGNWQS